MAARGGQPRPAGGAAQAGFGWVKVNFGWRDIEGAGKGIFDWSHTDQIVEMANADGIDLVVRVDHQPAWAGGGYPTNGPRTTAGSGRLFLRLGQPLQGAHPRL